MLTLILHRRAHWLAILVTLLVSAVPLYASAAGNHTATRTTLTFTLTEVDYLAGPDISRDAAGIYHYRDVTLEDVSGDLTGTAQVTYVSDYIPFDPGKDCLAELCFGEEDGWAHVEISAEDGGWTGTYVLSSSDIPGQEFYLDSLVLRGTGANAHQSLVAQAIDGDDDWVTFEGVRSTLPTPIVGLTTSVRLCADPDDASLSGSFLSSGAIAGTGGATGAFLAGRGPWTDSYAVAGTLILTDAHGSVTIAFGGGAQDNDTPTVEASHIWGYFVIVAGDGDYATLFGSGRIIGTASGPAASCASGFGMDLSMIGEAHAN